MLCCECKCDCVCVCLYIFVTVNECVCVSVFAAAAKGKAVNHPVYSCSAAQQQQHTARYKPYTLQ